MKKRTISAFTLVEMLIVIVIIGILIAALMPRMQAAQWRARDVSRKTALSQIQSAVVTSQWDRWEWPWQKTKGATWWIGVSQITGELRAAWMNSIPVDPLKSSVKWLWSPTTPTTSWDYAYLVTRRNWTPNGWFVLMAKTEVEWWSNWVVCDSSDTDLKHGYIAGNNSVDIIDIIPCTSLSKTGDAGTCQIDTGNQACYYKKDSELRYILVY